MLSRVSGVPCFWFYGAVCRAVPKDGHCCYLGIGVQNSVARWNYGEGWTLLEMRRRGSKRNEDENGSEFGLGDMCQKAGREVS